MFKNFITPILILSVVFLLQSCGNEDKITSHEDDSLSKVNVSMVYKPLEKRLFADKLEMNNCGPGTITRSIVNQVHLKKAVNVGLGMVVGSDISVDIPALVSAGVKAEIEKKYEAIIEQVISNSKSLTIEIPPWESVSFEVEYIEQKYAAGATFKYRNKTYKVPYEVALTAPDPKIRKQIVKKCPGRLAYMQLSPNSLQLFEGDSKVLQLKMIDTSGMLMSNLPATWYSSNDAIVSLGVNGEIYGRRPGLATVTAVRDDKKGTAVVTVLPTPAASIQIKSPATKVSVGQTLALRTTIRDSKGKVLNRAVNWSVNAPHIGSVDTNGHFRGLKKGNAIITAKSGEVFDTIQIEVKIKELETPFSLKAFLLETYPVKNKFYVAACLYSQETTKRKIYITIDNLYMDGGIKGKMIEGVYMKIQGTEDSLINALNSLDRTQYSAVIVERAIPIDEKALKIIELIRLPVYRWHDNQGFDMNSQYQKKYGTLP